MQFSIGMLQSRDNFIHELLISELRGINVNANNFVRLDVNDNPRALATFQPYRLENSLHRIIVRQSHYHTSAFGSHIGFMIAPPRAIIAETMPSIFLLSSSFGFMGRR